MDTEITGFCPEPWQRDTKDIRDFKALNSAVFTGDLNLLKYLVETEKLQVTTSTLGLSILYGHYKISDYLFFRGVLFNNNDGLFNGPDKIIDTFQYLKIRYGKIYKDLLVNFIVEDISLIIVSYLV